MKILTILCVLIIASNLNSTKVFSQKIDPILESARLRNESDERKLLVGTREEKYEIAMRKAGHYSYRKEYPEAMKIYKIAIEQNINPWAPYYDRAPLKEFLGDYRGAIDDWLKLETQLDNQQHNNDRLHIYNRIAICKENIEDYDGAIKYHLKKISIRKLSLDYNSIGKIYYKLKDYQNALRYFNDAIKLDSDDDSFFYNKGITLIKSGKTEDGCKALSRSGELGSSNAYEAIRKHCQ